MWVVFCSAGLSIQGVAKVDTSFVRSQVEFNVATEVKLNLVSDIDFYNSIALCLQLKQPDSVVRYTLHTADWHGMSFNIHEPCQSIEYAYIKLRKMINWWHCHLGWLKGKNTPFWFRMCNFISNRYIQLLKCNIITLVNGDKTKEASTANPNEMAVQGSWFLPFQTQCVQGRADSGQQTQTAQVQVQNAESIWENLRTKQEE